MNARSRKPARKDRVNIAGRWQSIPVSMLRDSTLSSDQRMLCALLYTYAGNDGTCYPLQQTLADSMGVRVRSVQSWLKTLHNAGYVDITRTMYGNLYTLREPGNNLTMTISGSCPDLHGGSSHAIPDADGHAILGSHASMTESHDHLESPIIPTHPPQDDDDDSGRLDSETGDERVGKLLKKVGVGAWKKLQKELAGIEFGLIERRVNKLVDQGKAPGIIVMSLRELDFEPGGMDEAGPLPMDKKYWEEQGFTLGGDDSVSLEQMLELSDADLKAFFEECRS